MKTYPITVDGPVPSEAAIAQMLRATAFEAFPRASDRKAWRAVARRAWVKPGVRALIQAAERVCGTPSPQMLATDYLAFARDGTRVPYQKAGPPRRTRLGTLRMAEVFEHKGRFLDAILNESWLIMEETSWVMSAHVRSDVPLPDAEEPAIDLAAAMTGRLLAETLRLLGEEMDGVVPQWRKRVHYELRQRVIEPYLKGGFWWEKTDNNWNAVCNCGVAASVLMGDFDVKTRARVLHQVLTEIRSFLTGFTADGGCTEGPGYWRYGVSWFAALAYYVECAAGGRIDLLADPVVPLVFEYPTKMILTGDQVVPFADCGPRVKFSDGPVAWAAGRAGVEPMVELASRRDTSEGSGSDLLDIVLCGRQREFQPPREAWLPDLQVMTARGSGPEGRQLVVAAKGGHNAEIHNHNDVGNFLAHWRGESLLCELGAGEYVRQMFSPMRYELLTTRSLGHNVPLLNGLEQRAGREYSARDVSCRRDGDDVTLSMDIAGAYPSAAGVRSLVRTLTCHRSDKEWVELTDEVAFSGRRRRYELPLYTAGRFRRAGRTAVRAKGENGSLRVEFEPGTVEVFTERFGHGDPRLEQAFGPTIDRCTFVLRGRPAKAAIRLRFIPA